MYDAHQVLLASAFTEHLRTLLASFPHTAPLIHTLPPTALFPDQKLTPTLLSQLLPSADADVALTDAFLLPALHHTRLIKDAGEIELIRKANVISSRAHETVMRVLGAAVRGQIKGGPSQDGRPLLPGEWLIEREEEAEAIFVASCRREG
jgi:Xaa-Pro dipeptidase